MKDYQTLDAAVAEAKKGEHIIKVHGSGYSIVSNEFVLDRNYFHDHDGKKVFFTFIETIR